jgi:hypothetical protein
MSLVPAPTTAVLPLTFTPASRVTSMIRPLVEDQPA